MAQGDFREASDWPSRGKAIQPGGFSVSGITLLGTGIEPLVRLVNLGV